METTADLLHPSAPPARRLLATRRGLVTLFVAAAVLATGCTGELRAEDDPPSATPPERLSAWPEDDAVSTTTSPAHPGVEVGVRPLIREPDGTTTLLVDITNGGTDSADLRSLFGTDGLAAARIVDPDSRVGHTPITSSDTARCLCSDVNLRVEAGARATAHLSFAAVDAEVEEVRVALPGWRPVDEVPVTRVARFETATMASTEIESDLDRGVTVEGVWRTDDGLLVRVEDRNDTPETVPATQLADLSGIAVVDLESERLGAARTRDDQTVADAAPDGGVPAGASVTRDVLVAAPSGAEVVVVLVPSTRRTLPIRVQDDAPEHDLDASDLDEARTTAVTGARIPAGTPLVDLAEPEEIAIDEVGPAVDLPDARPALTSEAQPGWSVAPRAVVRVGEDRSVLFLDIERGDTNESWPEGVGYQLAELALIDPAEDLRLGPLTGTAGTDASSSGVSVPTNGSRTAHVAFPAVADGSDSVTVDIPGFGRADQVPVVGGPAVASSGDPVLASMADDESGRLRVDVLAVGRLPGDAGTLVRFRRVNASASDAYEPPRDICGLTLSDPESDRRFAALDPCATTEWTRPLGVGEGLVYEVRFPNLPVDVETVTADLNGWLGTGPVAVADEVAPWYLDLPRPAEAPSGDVLTASIGVADELQSEIRSGDEVDLNLDTDVLFAFGSAALAPEAVARLQAVGERLTGEVSGTVSVVGHTDSVGDAAANQTLSEQRAQAVADVLAPILGESVELEVEGRGDTEPVAANEVDGRDDPDGRARNRRVTITYDAA